MVTASRNECVDADEPCDGTGARLQDGDGAQAAR